VLDAMSEPVLLLHVATGTVRPVNAAATRWISCIGSRADGISVAELFPEWSPVSIPTTDVDLVLTRANYPSDSGVQDVVLRVFPVALDPDQRDEPQSLAIVVRSLVPRSGERDVLPRDAIDDSFHDSLTRLPNRRLFQRRLERAVERGAHADYHFALLFVDLDGFKQVNDQFGHLQGDRLLVVAAHRMVEAVRPQDMVARRDGDEFTILLDDLARPDDAVHIAQRIVQHLRAPMPIDGAAPVTIGASIGIAMGGVGGSSVDDLIARADAAMYEAKASGGGAFIVAPTPPVITANTARRTRRLPR
jgi:diguanylate cyclase (GGDEF)-like protein